MAAVQGFANAVLVGTAIMKSPEMADAIQEIKRPTRKFKACGIRTNESARFCEENAVSFVGVNFVPTSKRCVTLEKGKALVPHLKKSLSVGVFQNQPLEEVQSISDTLELDMVQLSGGEDPAYCAAISRPVIKTLKENELGRIKDYEDVVAMFIFDGSTPGSGKGYDYTKLQGIETEVPFLIAGGVHQGNTADILKSIPRAAGVDMASGIETNGVVDQSKLDRIARIVAGVTT
jgi:phosphoribosylanthranilate isomerase